MSKRNLQLLSLRVLFIVLAYLVFDAHTMSAQSTPPDWIGEKNNTWRTGLALPTRPLALSQAHSSPVRTANLTNAANWLMTIYQTDMDGNWEIYQYQWLGSKRLTTNSAADTTPRLNFGATQIVFVSDRDGNSEIYRMNADGSNQTRLTNHRALDITPAWSPEGSQIVFSSKRDGNLEIYSMQQNGAGLRRLTNLSGDDFAPDWSPDGRQIIWVHTIAKDQRELWVMNADGGNPHQLISAKRYLQHPVWSPDGARIAFDYDATGDGLNELALVNRDGSGLQSFNLDLSSPHDEWMGSWAPDGTTLYFTEIQFFPENNKLVPGATSLQEFCVTTLTYCGTFDEDLIDPASPDVKSRDLWPPASQVESLANFSRQSSLLVYWRGRDQGPSGLQGYDVQYRLAANSEWTDWISGTHPDPVLVDPTASVAEYEAGAINTLPAGKVYFRSRAMDQADNLEAWPLSNKGDTSTTVFRWLLQGRVTDVRNNALALLPIPVEPAALNAVKTDSAGQFMAYLGSDGKYQLNQSMPLTMTSDYARDFYVLPQNNLVHDGGFEEANLADFWQVNHLAGAQLSDGPPHTGQHSLTLGQPCSTGCLSPLSASGVDTRFILLLRTDAKGNLHMFSRKGNSLYYQLRQGNGDWQPYTVLANGGSIGIWTVSATFDQQGNLHALWNEGVGLNVQSEAFYAMRSANGNWSTPLSLGIVSKHKLIVDSTNRLHLLYTCINLADCTPQQLRYRTRSPEGVWSTDQIVATARYFYLLDAIGTADNTVHVFWSSASEAIGTEQLLYRPLVNGKWGTQQIIDEGFYESQTGRNRHESLALQVDSQQALHLAWAGAPLNMIFYRTKPYNGAWSPTELLSADTPLSPIWEVQMRLDAKDNLHLLGLRMGFRQPLYWHRKLGQNWSTPRELTLFSAENQFLADLAISAADGKYVAINDYSKPSATLLAEEHATNTSDSQISQTVTLPVALHRPTLAFMYQLEGGATGQSSFNVAVTNDVTTTTVFSSNELTPWTLGWADLDAWKGQTITITFGVHQAANDPYLHVDLDEITLSAWQTPLVQQIAPAQIAGGGLATLIITGENFIATPTVTLGETPLASVRWLTEQRLEVTVPSNIAPGIYDLLISNPTGETYRRSRAVAVGQQRYLPIIQTP